MVNYNIEKSIQKLFKWSYTFALDIVLSFCSHEKRKE